MKKAVLFLLLFMAASLQLSADIGKGFIYVYLHNEQVDSIAVDGIYDISHSKYDLQNKEHPDYVTTVITTENDTYKYLIADIERIETPMPIPLETITMGNSLMVVNNNVPRQIYFNGNFPAKPGDQTVYRWEEMDSIYINMDGDDFAYKAKLDSMSKDSTWAWFETVKVKHK